MLWGTAELARLLDSLPAGAYTCNADGLITYYNRRAVDLWGREPALHSPEDRFCGSFRLLEPNGHPVSHGECWMALALKRRTCYYGEEIVVERRDGSRVTVLAHASPIFDDAGELTGAVNVLMDISERKEAEEHQRRLESAIAHMGRLNLAGEMASGFAHELNQPLTSISNLAEACINRIEAGNARSEDIVSTLTRVSAQAQQAGDIIRRLRGFIRKGSLERVPTDLHGLIDEAVRLVAIDAARAGVAVRVHRCPGMPRLELDPVQIQQVLVNLMRNSIEAMTQQDTYPRELTVSADCSDDYVTLAVSDTGPGLAPEIRDLLFHPFTTTRDDGMGLGLSISQTIVQGHGGELWAASPPGGGAEFRFTLPGERTRRIAAHSPPSSSSAARTRS